MTKSKAKIRGRIVKPGPVQPLPEPADPLAWLVNRLQVDDNGQPLMEGIFSNYNDDILLEVDSNTLIGRYDPERGPAQRLEIGSGLRVEDGVLIGEGGGEKGDPGPPGPPGPMGPEGPAGASTSRFFYRFDRNSQVASDPGAGYMRYSATTPGATVRLYVDALTSEGFDVITMFKAATLDDEFLIQDKDNSANYHHFRQIGAGIDRGGWFEVPVAYVTQAGASFTQNQEIAVLLRARGEPGPVGPIGPIGPVGPQGPQGFQGPKGDTGNTGPVGPQGAQGNVGPQGQQGVVGPKGDTGAQGPQGNTGATGAKGDKGDQGVIGPRGDTGAQGPQGLIGPEGPKGDTGDTGPQGLQGIQGEQGEVGPAGPPGGLGEAPVDGKTYGRKDAAWAEVESGGASVTVGDTPPPAPEQGALWWESDSGIFWLWYDDGDSAQWVQTGEQGPIGPQGPPGADGADGATGAQGEVGPQGIQGPPGADGATGAQGAQGAQGLQGPQGPQGAQGIQGVQGPPGPWTQLTQAQYNALSPPNPATLYVIVG